MHAYSTTRSRPSSPHRGPAATCILTIAIALLAAAPARAVTAEEVRLSIRAAIQYLRDHQGPNGTWADYGPYQGATTSLAVLALRSAGVPSDDPVIVRASEAIRRTPNQYTYAVSLKAQALAASDPEKYHAEIVQAAAWLCHAQLDRSGLWTYQLSPAGGDHSNSQFALLGLHEAARAGARVPEAVWQRAETSWLRSQRADGGWTYVETFGASTGSMTSAGVASLYIVGSDLMRGHEHGYANGRAPNCGRYTNNKAVAAGLDWLAEHFDPERNPPQGQHYYYYLYAVERVGMLSGLKYFGKHDWYRLGAAALAKRQRGDGSWGDINNTVETSFALLFLAKGRPPLLLSKLRWHRDDRWNPDRNDVRHLVEFIGDKLGEPMSWQIVDVDAPLEDWLSAPVLYFHGHTFPDFTAEQKQRLVEYVRQGGAIVAEACCSEPAFRRGFEALAAEIFPEAPLRPLGPEHPIFSAHYQIKPVEVLGIDAGCRTSIVFLPNDVSCLWEQADVPELSEEAFRLGTNIAAYLTGKQKLPDKLDAVEVAHTELDAKVPAAALYVAQLQHSGDWRPDGRAMSNLAEFLRRSSDVDVVPQTIPLAATDPALRKHPIAFLTGHFPFRLTPEQITALRAYLDHGGFLFADACCGRETFDASFREMAASLYPDAKLEPLPASHPILSGELGFDVSRVQYRPAALAQTPGLDQPKLEGIERGGRTVVVYSRYGVGCPIDGHACYGCCSYEPDDARKLAANIVLYALSY